MPNSSPTTTEDPVEKMNRMYRWTRHVYDWSRRYYLLGRDQMLETIADQPKSSVLEIGCGTARNLRLLDDQAPHHALFGIDASLSMLATARAKLEQEGRLGRITLGHGLAQQLNPKAQLGESRDFDIIFCSYVLSMIPDWAEALEAALAHLSPDGRIHIVDFWDQDNLPSWAGDLLQRWLALFDVYPRPNLMGALRRLDEVDGLSCTIRPICRRYAYHAMIHVSEAVPHAVGGMLEGGEGQSSFESKRFDSGDVIAA